MVREFGKRMAKLSKTRHFIPVMMIPSKVVTIELFLVKEKFAKHIKNY